MITIKSGMIFKKGHIHHGKLYLKNGKIILVKLDEISISYEGVGLEKKTVFTIESEIPESEIRYVRLFDSSGDCRISKAF